MCGITGILSQSGEPASPVLLRRMTAAIAHRGPDGEGFYTDGEVGLGHRRLAIIDLSPAGHQPMVTPDGRFAISYNGEVYNFQELRAELEALGHQFHSQTDSEVVLYAFAEWGLASLQKLNGMFAFAVWDKERRVLTLARDRYGIKPLYYAKAGDTLLFASEVKAILQHPAYRTDLDRQALYEYFTFQNLFSDRTLFAGVSLMPAGCHLSIGTGRGEVSAPIRYWDYCFQEPESRLDDREYAEEVDRLFRQAVSRQLVSDAPVGAYLSGGIDSGSITALAAQQYPYLKSFTVGFDISSASGIELACDERRKAEHLSYLFKTEHYEMVLKAGDMERKMSDLVWHLEDLRVGQSHPNFYAAGLASKFVKVALSGAGGDELFGGYPWRYYRAVVNSDFEHYIDKYYQFWQRLIPNRSLREVFAPIWPDVEGVWTRDIFKDVFDHHAASLTRPEDYVNHSLYFEARTFLHGLLVVDDKLSMAHGLETRVPFLDNDLVDFAQTIPVGLKLGKLGEVVRLNENEPGRKTRRYFEKTRDGKLLLRSVLGKYVPDDISAGEKQGFVPPDASWYRGESIDYVRSVFFDERTCLYDFMDRTAVRNLVNEHLDGRANRRLLLWSLLCFEHWCRRFLRDADA